MTQEELEQLAKAIAEAQRLVEGHWQQLSSLSSAVRAGRVPRGR
jgi:hypothetical protein